ncbi:hypothetical protein OG792_30320 [Micromonospora sp. NBC_01699]|uniref:hypothetical protein n=1 Tax=Micromonospora sp. NBC_01699 TaxID=2975984 RepID=UPI002E28803D|nr:hypothetical protein [Micromonospora sp. NBC_01699]
MLKLGAHRAAVSLLALSLAATGVAVIGSTGTASAAPHYSSPGKVQVGYTDSATPKIAHDEGGSVNMPLGTWQDEAGGQHTSRIYATFDLSAYEGKKIYGGSVFIREYSAADCTKRAIEIWRTKPVDATPTWKRPPAPLAKIDEILTPQACPSAYITFDIAAAVQDAIQKRQRRITFEIRVPEQYEADPSYGRRLYWYSSVSMNVQYNSLPTVDNNNLYNGGFPCTALKPYPRLSGLANVINVVGSDADEQDRGRIDTTVAIWPTGQPENRTEFTDEYGTSGRANSPRIPETALVDGTSYVWQASVGDGRDVSAWSKKCYFTYDRTRPTSPTITSSNYPEDDSGEQTPIGVPGVFTFSGNGDKDVAGFAYSWSELGVPACSYSGEFGQLECTSPFDGPDTVRANRPGGSATVTLSPDRYGPQRLYVRTLDLAGNVSPTVTYDIFVPSTAPTVTALSGPPEWNQEVRLKFSPAAGLTVNGYEYTLDNGEPQRLYPDSEGYAYLSFQASNVYGHQVTVRSHGDNGFVSSEGNWSVNFGPWPGVRSEVYPAGWEPAGGVGVPGEFAFSPPPGWTEVAAYRYTFDGGESTELAAGPDGRATITWTPTAAGWMTLIVYAVRADGTVSDDSNWYSFLVADTA